MSKYVRDTKAAKSLSAYVILKKGVEVAHVTAHFSDGGAVLVNCHNIGDRANDACVKASGWELKGRHSYEIFGCQVGRASGGGYDKFTAALSGCWIDGHMIYNHCGHSDASIKMLKAYRKAFDARVESGSDTAHGTQQEFQKAWDRRAEKIGARFANWDKNGGYSSLFMQSGLDRLRTLGYQVIQAV